MTISIPIISLQELKVLLPVRSGNTDFDARMSQAIEVATLQLEGHCHRLFAKQTHVQFFSSRQTHRNGFARGEQILTLHGMPVDEGQPIIVSYDPVRVWDADDLIDTSNYHVDDEGGRIFLRIGSRVLIRSIKVEYTAGYEAVSGTLSDNAPEDLKMACAIQAANIFHRSDPNNIGVTERQGKGKNATAKWSRESGITPEAASYARRFRRVLTGVV